MDIAQEKDIQCCLSGYDISFDLLGSECYPTPVRCVNDGSLLKDHKEFVMKMLEFAGSIESLRGTE